MSGGKSNALANYLQQQSVGAVLRNTAAIYRSAFGVLLATFTLPMLPLYFWQSEATAAEAHLSLLISYACSLLIVPLAFGATVVAVSDICLGNRPSVLRSYRWIFSGVAINLLLASALQTVVMVGGFCLLLVPGLFALTWLLFVPVVVVLEKAGPWQAMKRSVELAKGHNLRNLAVIALLLVALMAVLLVTMLPLLLLQEEHQEVALRITSNVMTSLFFPSSYIAVVLLYYDIRVRKEAYDAAALAEDLHR